MTIPDCEPVNDINRYYPKSLQLIQSVYSRRWVGVEGTSR